MWRKRKHASTCIPCSCCIPCSLLHAHGRMFDCTHPFALHDSRQRMLHAGSLAGESSMGQGIGTVHLKAVRREVRMSREPAEHFLGVCPLVSDLDNITTPTTGQTGDDRVLHTIGAPLEAANKALWTRSQATPSRSASPKYGTLCLLGPTLETHVQDENAMVMESTAHAFRAFFCLHFESMKV